MTESVARENAFDRKRLLADNDTQRNAERAAAEAAYTGREPKHPSPQNAHVLREALARADERHTAQRIAILAQEAYLRCLATVEAAP